MRVMPKLSFQDRESFVNLHGDRISNRKMLNCEEITIRLPISRYENTAIHPPCIGGYQCPWSLVRQYGRFNSGDYIDRSESISKVNYFTCLHSNLRDKTLQMKMHAMLHMLCKHYIIITIYT